MLLIIFCFGREIRVAHGFLLCERDTCCSSIFGRGFVLLIVFCFGRGFRAAHRLLLEGVLCFSSPFALGGDPCFSSFFCFGRRIRVAHRFLF